MDLARLGLKLDFLGMLMVGFASYFGLAAGFGGPIVWTTMGWKITYFLGWVCLAVGFLLQHRALKRTSPA